MADNWQTRAPLPTVNAQHGVAAIGTKLYVAGGTANTSAVLNTLYEWDQLTDAWAAKAPMPNARRQAGVAAIGTKLYVAGGAQTWASPADAKNTLYEWDQLTDAWAAKAPMPVARYSPAACVAIGTKLYFAGGLQVSGGSEGETNTLYEWDQTTNTWTTKAPMPNLRAAGAGGVVGTKFYVPCGSLGGVPTNTLYEWDQTTNTWTTKVAFPAQRRSHGCAVIGSNLYVVAGQGTTDVATLWERPVASSVTTVKAPLPEARAHAASAAIGGLIYAVAGSLAGARKDTLYEWGGDLTTWTFGMLGV